MKILSWNIEGVGRKGFVNQVHEIVMNHHPNILVLMKAKLISKKASFIVN